MHADGNDHMLFASALAALLSLTSVLCPAAVAVVDLQGQGAQTTELAQLMQGPAFLAGKRIRVMVPGTMLAYDAVSLLSFSPTCSPLARASPERTRSGCAWYLRKHAHGTASSTRRQRVLFASTEPD